MAELVTGWTVTERGPLEVPFKRSEGCFSLYSVDSTDHGGEATKVLPIMLRDALAMQVDPDKHTLSPGAATGNPRWPWYWSVIAGGAVVAGVGIVVSRLRSYGRI